MQSSKFIRITSGSHLHPRSHRASESVRRHMSRRALQLAAWLCLTMSGQVFAADLTSSQEVALLNQMAHNGNHDAQLQLGLAYQEGRYGLEPNAETGRYWLKLAATGGQTYAADVLANVYAKGPVPDMYSAMHWWKVAAADNNVDAQFHLGEELVAAGQPQGKHWLEKAADKGDKRAEAVLQKLCSRNAVPTSDLQRGKQELDVLSARLQQPTLKAAAEIWDAMSTGLSAEKTASQLEKDAIAGDSIAAYQLAIHYRDGAWDVNRDPAKALYWLRQAANDGNPVAMKTLANVYRHGELGVEPDEGRAKQWDVRSQGKSIQANSVQTATSRG